MPRFIVKLTKKKKDHYFMWSTIVDAPTSMNMSEGAALQYLKDNLTSAEYKKSVKSLKEKGVSNYNYSLDDILETNDLGCSTVDELTEYLCQ